MACNHGRRTHFKGKPSPNVGNEFARNAKEVCAIIGSNLALHRLLDHLDALDHRCERLVCIEVRSRLLDPDDRGELACVVGG